MKKHDSARTSIERKVNRAIKANPAIAYLRDHHKKNRRAKRLWNEAIAIDNMLKELPRWKKRTLKDRFAAVVQLLEYQYGQLPH